jgi:hypothetical protein
VFDEAVEIGIAAFLREPAPSDDEVQAALTAGGLEPWLAKRLAVFLPLAFGRRVLPGVELSDSFSDGPQTVRRLADDPVFVAAAARAQQGNRAEVERIGLRSSEVVAVNNALNSGSRMEDLVCGPAVVADPLPPLGDDDGGVPSPRAAFLALVAGHGVAIDGNRAGPAELDAQVYPTSDGTPGMFMAQVDFIVRHPALAKSMLVESFAGGGGSWRDALVQCITKFERASLHPIVAALLAGNTASDQVEWEHYVHPSGSFQLCLGPQISLYSARSAQPMGPVLDRLLHALRGVPLSGAVHSLRVFSYYSKRELAANEVLLDGEQWDAGAAQVASAPPPDTDEPIGVRLFGLLVPHFQD